MRSALHLFNEDARLASLAEYDLLSGTDDVDLDQIVQLAARLFDAPIALVSLIERDTQTFKARVGIERVAPIAAFRFARTPSRRMTSSSSPMPCWTCGSPTTRS